MEGLLAEQANLESKGSLKKTVDDVQKMIDLLTNARESIAADASTQAMTLAKLKTPMKNSFERVNGDLKEIYSSLNKYSKALDKQFKPVTLPTANNDPLSTQQELTNRAIAMHLLREGQFGVANTFIAEASSKPPRTDFSHTTTTASSVYNPTYEADDVEMEDSAPNPASWTNEFAPRESTYKDMGQDGSSPAALQESFAEMYNILRVLQTDHDLEPAITWARSNSEALDLRGSNLEFELCRLRFVELYKGASPPSEVHLDAVMTDGGEVGGGGGMYSMESSVRALAYARETFIHFSSRYTRETAALLGSLAYSPHLASSPYKSLFYDSDAWNHVAKSFVREFCGMLGLSEQSPLYTAVTAGGIALPVLEKLERVMGEVGGQWSSVEELPVEIPLPPSFLFHSIFVCPVSKEQATDANPPMMMPCGHVIAKESIEKISRGNKRFKCPYCPAESYPREAKKVFL